MGEQVGKYYVTYETDLMRALMNLTPVDLCDLRALPRGPYHSNWRTLHVDGFEGGKTIQFYYPVHYEFKMGVVPPRAQRQTTQFQFSFAETAR